MGSVIQSVSLHTVEEKPVLFRKTQGGCLEITFEGKTMALPDSETMLLKAFMLRKDW